MITFFKICFVILVITIFTRKDKDGYNILGRNEKGFDREGYDKKGFKNGRNRKLINKYTGTKYDKEGYDYYGYNKFGRDRRGFDVNGLYYGKKYDIHGFDKEGFDKNGFYENHINKYTHTKFDMWGYDYLGYDKDGFNKLGFNAKGFNKNGIHYETKTKYDIEGYDNEGYNNMGRNKDPYRSKNKKTGNEYDEKGFNRWGRDKEGYDREGFNYKGRNREGIFKNTGTKYDNQGYDIIGRKKPTRTVTKKNTITKKTNHNGNGIKICSIASGSNGNCYYIGNDKEAILIDDGISYRMLTTRMKEVNLDIESIIGIFISHEHSDHIKGLPMFHRNHPNVPIYFNKEAFKTVKYSDASQYSDGVKDLINKSVKIGGFNIHPFKKKHDVRFPLSFRVESNGISIGIFTDIGIIDENLEKEFGKCNAAFIESNYDYRMLMNGPYPEDLKTRVYNNHLSNNDAIELINSNASEDLQVVIFSHLSEKNNHPNKVKNLYKEINEKYIFEIASRNEVGKVHTIYERNIKKKIKKTEQDDLRKELKQNKKEDEIYNSTINKNEEYNNKNEDKKIHSRTWNNEDKIRISYNKKEGGKFLNSEKDLEKEIIRLKNEGINFIKEEYLNIKDENNILLYDGDYIFNKNDKQIYYVYWDCEEKNYVRKIAIGIGFQEKKGIKDLNNIKFKIIGNHHEGINPRYEKYLPKLEEIEKQFFRENGKE